MEGALGRTGQDQGVEVGQGWVSGVAHLRDRVGRGLHSPASMLITPYK